MKGMKRIWPWLGVVVAVVACLGLRSVVRQKAARSERAASGAEATRSPSGREIVPRDERPGIGRDEAVPAVEKPLLGSEKQGASTDRETTPGLTEEWIEFERLSGTMLTPAVPASVESLLWRSCQALATNRMVDVPAYGLRMLSSTGAFTRLTGAVFMIENQRRLDGTVMERLIDDEAIFVPLTALGWLREAGLKSYADQFEALWLRRPETLAALTDALRNEPLSAVAGRAALGLLDRAQWSPEEKRELFLDVLADAQSDYGTRWQAALLLRDQMDFADYQATIRDSLDIQPAATRAGAQPTDAKTAARAVTAPADQAFSLAMQLLNERTAGPVEVMSGPVTLTRDDADLFFAHESAVMLEHVAAWVERAAEKPQSVIVRTGFTAAVKDYLAEIPRDELPAAQLLALRRIESNLDTVRALESE